MENKSKPKNPWKSPFYYDPKDARLTVPRPIGTGWKLNFGHRGVIAIIGAVILLLAIIAGRLTNH